MDETEVIRLAFIDVAIFSDSSIRGGILTTDIETRPYEFRATSPIKPTQLQQILYGGSLKDYVYNELICVPLVRATKEKLSVVLVKESYLLAMRPHVSVPVILVQDEHNQVLEGLKPLSLIFSSHKNFTNELSYAQTILIPIAQKHNLLEPFKRLELALTEVNRMGVGEKGKGA
jgi:hypothetical protein